MFLTPGRPQTGGGYQAGNEPSEMRSDDHILDLGVKGAGGDFDTMHSDNHYVTISSLELHLECLETVEPF